MFYTKQEFAAQVQELVEEGYTLAEATAMVKVQEQSDRADYEQWLDHTRISARERDYV